MTQKGVVNPTCAAISDISIPVFSSLRMSCVVEMNSLPRARLCRCIRAWLRARRASADEFSCRHARARHPCRIIYATFSLTFKHTDT